MSLCYAARSQMAFCKAADEHLLKIYMMSIRPHLQELNLWVRTRKNTPQTSKLVLCYTVASYSNVARNEQIKIKSEVKPCFYKLIDASTLVERLR